MNGWFQGPDGLWTQHLGPKTDAEIMEMLLDRHPCHQETDLRTWLESKLGRPLETAR